MSDESKPVVEVEAEVPKVAEEEKAEVRPVTLYARGGETVSVYTAHPSQLKGVSR